MSHIETNGNMALYMSDSLARVEGHLIGVRFWDCIKPHPVCSRRMYESTTISRHVRPPVVLDCLS